MGNPLLAAEHSMGSLITAVLQLHLHHSVSISSFIYCEFSRFIVSRCRRIQ
uniref:Uncharacterized protein n=1 Tax=Anguilla anguilla TaxID=7936 RepID=A0A0E9UB55_ANGAN